MQNNCEEKLNYDLLAPCLEEYGNKPGSIITILQKAQDIYGYLPMPLIEYIALSTNQAPAKVLGVASFYTQFRTKPVGKHLILLCQGTACHVNGSGEIEAVISNHLQIKEGEISEDGLFTYNNVACLGCCSLAPAIMIGEKTYGNLDKDKTIEILDAIAKEEA